MRVAVLSLFLATALLCGCGVKPDAVDPPQGKEQDQFPRTYPSDPATEEPHRYMRR